MGVELEKSDHRISMRGDQVLVGTEIKVPADLSSASFVMLATLLSSNAEVTIETVGINPTRTGVIEILRTMGADISLRNERQYGDEPVADISVRSSTLNGCDIDPALVSLAIDEFPVLFVAASAAVGATKFSGLAELRVKESDRNFRDGQGSAGVGSSC